MRINLFHVKSKESSSLTACRNQKCMWLVSVARALRIASSLQNLDFAFTHTHFRTVKWTVWSSQTTIQKHTPGDVGRSVSMSQTMCTHTQTIRSPDATDHMHQVTRDGQFQCPKLCVLTPGQCGLLMPQTTCTIHQHTPGDARRSVSISWTAFYIQS